MHGTRRNEDEGSWPDPLCWIGVGVKRVRTFQDIEGFCLVMGVRWVIEVRVLPCLSEGPVPPGLSAGCLAHNAGLQATHGQDDPVPIVRPAQKDFRSLPIGHS